MTTALPRPKNARQVLAAGLGVLGAVSVLVYVAGLGPILGASAARAQAEARLHEAERDANSAARDAGSKQARLRALRGSQAGARVRLQPAAQINPRMQDLTDLIASKGLTIEGQQADQPEYKLEHYGTVAIRFRAEGTYPQCATLVRAIGERFPDVGVESLEVAEAAAGHAAGGSQNRVLLSLGLVWYVRPRAAGG